MELHTTSNMFVVEPIKIINTSGKTLNSTPDMQHPVYLSYHLYDITGNILQWNNRETILEIDIKNEYVQGLLINLPHHKGTYIIEADLHTKDIRWWKTTCRFKLIYN
jgi:hypothetical protein